MKNSIKTKALPMFAVVICGLASVAASAGSINFGVSLHEGFYSVVGVINLITTVTACIMVGKHISNK